MRKKNKNIPMILFMLFVLFFMIGMVFEHFRYTAMVSRQFNKQTKQYLKEFNQKSADYITRQFKNILENLSNMAGFIQPYEDILDENLKQVCMTQIQTNDSVFFVTDNKGKYYSFGKETYDVSQQKWYQEALAGQPVISDVVLAVEGQKEAVICCVPVVGENGRIEKTIGREIFLEDLSSVLQIEILGNQADVFLIKADGTMMLKPDSAIEMDNLYQLFSDEKNSRTVASKLKINISNGKNEILTYQKGENRRYISISQELDNGWYVINIGAAHVTQNYLEKVQRDGRIQGFLSIVFFLFLFICLFGRRCQNWFREGKEKWRKYRKYRKQKK